MSNLILPIYPLTVRYTDGPFKGQQVFGCNQIYSLSPNVKMQLITMYDFDTGKFKDFQFSLIPIN